MLYKENQDLKAEMQNLRNYYDREKLISQSKKTMRNFPSRSHKEKIRYQRPYESSGNKETDDEEKYVYSKKKKQEKNMTTLMTIMMTLMMILMIMGMTKNFLKIITIIMIMMKNAIKIKITKK